VGEAFGEFLIKLDDKGRVILPAKLRDQLHTGAYLTRGQDKCLFLFSSEQFVAYRERNREAAPAGMPALAFDRVFYSSVVTSKVDNQGRVTIPPKLRSYAALDRELAVVGLEERLEIWDAQRWQGYLDRYTEQFAALQDGIR
jgi:MraZ protein